MVFAYFAESWLSIGKHNLNVVFKNISLFIYLVRKISWAFFLLLLFFCYISKCFILNSYPLRLLKQKEQTLWRPCQFSKLVNCSEPITTPYFIWGHHFSTEVLFTPWHFNFLGLGNHHILFESIYHLSTEVFTTEILPLLGWEITIFYLRPLSF